MSSRVQRRALAALGSRSPTVPPGVWDKTSFHMTRDEAAYLRDRLMSSVPEVLLTSLVEAGSPLV